MALMSTILEVVCAGDLLALNGFLESDVVCTGRFTAQQIRELWKICEQVWEGYSPVGRVLLGTLMARLQAAYPMFSLPDTFCLLNGEMKRYRNG